MKVFILEVIAYGQSELLGVFTTQELAEGAQDESEFYSKTSESPRKYSIKEVELDKPILS